MPVGGRLASLADKPLSPPENITDQDLRRAAGGDRQALAAVIRLEWPRIHRIVVAETGNRDDAEDLTEEAFARVLPRLDGFADGGALHAYLAQVARNLVRDRWRRRRFVDPSASVLDGTADGPGPEALALAGLDRAALSAALGRLPAEYRRVLRLRLIEGRSSDQVGALLGRSAPAVRQLQHRALVRLRAEFAAVTGRMPTTEAADA
jgi:RNA polymerase sigma-70 factor (ECF subfamily)